VDRIFQYWLLNGVDSENREIEIFCFIGRNNISGTYKHDNLCKSIGRIYGT
jgi:hypothetical protein